LNHLSNAYLRFHRSLGVVREIERGMPFAKPLLFKDWIAWCELPQVNAMCVDWALLLQGA
jgi:hypothetical protein